MKKEKYFTVARISRISVLGALAFLLMFFEFSLPMIAPSFYKLDFSEIPVLIGGFSMGPLAAVVIEFLKIVLHLLFKGTRTAFVGEFANFLIGCAFVCPAAYLYRRQKNTKTLLRSLFIGIVSMTAAGFVLNVWVVIPAYVHMGFPLASILAAGQAIFPAIHSVLSLVIFCTTPFNLLKGFLLALMTYLLYPRVSSLLHKEIS